MSNYRFRVHGEQRDRMYNLLRRKLGKEQTALIHSEAYFKVFVSNPPGFVDIPMAVSFRETGRNKFAYLTENNIDEIELLEPLAIHEYLKYEFESQTR